MGLRPAARPAPPQRPALDHRMTQGLLPSIHTRLPCCVKAGLAVGDGDVDHVVEAAGTEERGVDQVGPVRRGEHGDAAQLLRAVHLREHPIRWAPGPSGSPQAHGSLPDRGGLPLGLLDLGQRRFREQEDARHGDGVLERDADHLGRAARRNPQGTP